LYLAAFPVHYADLINIKFIGFEIVFLIDIIMTFFVDIEIPNRTGGIKEVHDFGEIAWHYWESRRLLWDIIAILPL